MSKKILLVSMNSQNKNRTDFLISKTLKQNFNFEVKNADLAEWIKHEGVLVANEYLFHIKTGFRDEEPFDPDIVLYSGIECVDYTIYDRYRDSKQIIWFFDAPFHVDVCKRGNYVDYLFITANGLVDDYRYWGVNCHWLLEGVCNPPYGSGKATENYEYDLAFTGTPDIRRNELLTYIYDSLDINLGIWGNNQGPPYFGLDNYRWNDRLPHTGSVMRAKNYSNLCAKSKIILGINVYNNIYQYFSNRNLFTLASHGFLLTHYVPGIEELFENHKHLVWYKNKEECVELIEYYLDRPNERMQIANNGYELAHLEYSMEGQLQKMFDICDIDY